MVKKENKLKLDKDFERLFKEGRGTSGSFYIIKMLFRGVDGVKPSKFGFVVPKKAVKLAVTRNKIKRKTSEIVRNMLKKGLIKQNFDISVVAKAGAATADTADLEKDLANLFTKLKLFC